MQPPEEPSRPERSLVPLAVGLYALLFAIAATWAAIAGRSLVHASPEAELDGVRWADAGIGVVAGLAVVLVSRLLTHFTEWGKTLSREMAELLGPLSTNECIALALLSGIAEEALFRGALQPQVGLVAASVIFGLAHFAPKRSLWPWTAFAFAAGFGLGALFEWTGNLVAPVVAHVVINAINLRSLARLA